MDRIYMYPLFLRNLPISVSLLLNCSKHTESSLLLFPGFLVGKNAARNAQYHGTRTIPGSQQDLRFCKRGPARLVAQYRANVCQNPKGCRLRHSCPILISLSPPQMCGSVSGPLSGKRQRPMDEHPQPIRSTL